MLGSPMSVKSRRAEYSDATRAALLDAARPLFAEHGYAATSLEQVAKSARVTKGAIYHHFRDKRALFTAVVERVHEAVLARVLTRSVQEADTWTRTLAGIDAFLEGCLTPEFQRVVLQEAPAVMGWRAWREMDERYGLGLVREALRELAEAGEIVPGPHGSLDMLARLLLGALTEAAMTIANADDVGAARAEAGRLLAQFLGALRR